MVSDRGVVYCEGCERVTRLLKAKRPPPETGYWETFALLVVLTGAIMGTLWWLHGSV